MEDWTVTIQQTSVPINHSVEGKEFCLQYTKRGYRCISWYPHYIMTNWVKTRGMAVKDGDTAIEIYYEEHKC